MSILRFLRIARAANREKAARLKAQRGRERIRSAPAAEAAEAAQRPHEHLEFHEPADFYLTDREKEEVRGCVECRRRLREAACSTIRSLADQLPPAFLKAMEAAVSEGEETDPLQREEKAWSDTDKGIPQRAKSSPKLASNRRTTRAAPTPLQRG